jgi:uncharacterized membrane protein (UPF0127 family)
VPPRARIAVAVVVALGALAGMIAIVVRVRADESTTGHLSFAASTPAAAPFGAFSEARVAVGSKCLRVLVASSMTQRVQGLRDVRSLAPYDGMLFVFPSDTDARFTMASTPLRLDATFFSAQGAPVDEVSMSPCPEGSDATCPVYASKGRYRYALERPAGSGGGAGALGACAG